MVVLAGHHDSPIIQTGQDLHHFGLSGRNYRGLVGEGITLNHAITRIRELFSEILSPDDLGSLIEYEGETNLIKALLNGPFFALVGS